MTDTGSHGGQIVTGSPSRSCDGLKVARVGDIYDCPIHGPNPIVTGSSISTAEGRKVARVGDRTECGAVIVTGSPTHSDNG
ncbi:PAAR domain-containing protein [Aurantimonas sp. VKM B-3413]|uniref:PAAR domain-containing protein n=1 Tax=Aurantimonas sp. VKM B-3413 TaxID=2779401 RepID=UPI001E418ADA|nr:PAAR domain-containing protein [Aurantimonas sp. VKM B-3413]